MELSSHTMTMHACLKEHHTSKHSRKEICYGAELTDKDNAHSLKRNPHPVHDFSSDPRIQEQSSDTKKTHCISI